MLEGNLHTTNLLLGIMAAASLLQALVVIGVGVLACRFYRQTLQAIRNIEQRRIAPLAADLAARMGSVDGILADVKTVTARVARRTERVDAAVQDTMHAVDDTASRVRGAVEWRFMRLARLAYGVTSAIRGLFSGRCSGETPGQVR